MISYERILLQVLTMHMLVTRSLNHLEFAIEHLTNQRDEYAARVTLLEHKVALLERPSVEYPNYSMQRQQQMILNSLMRENQINRDEIAALKEELAALRANLNLAPSRTDSGTVFNI